MKKIFVMFALLLGVVAVKAQTTDTVQYVAGNNLCAGPHCGSVSPARRRR